MGEVRQASMTDLQRDIAELRELISNRPPTTNDIRLNEKQKRHMKIMMTTLGIDEYDAKLRVLCMGTPPDHFEQIPAGGNYPKMLYSKDGKFTSVTDEEEHEIRKKEGWLDKPTKTHLEKLQRGTQPRDENIKRLQRELESEIVSKEREVALQAV